MTWRIANEAQLDATLRRLVPTIEDELDEVNRDTAADLTARARGRLSGAFATRIGGGLRAGDDAGIPAVLWSGGRVLSGGGTVDELWPAAEWGSSLFPNLPPRTPSGHLFAAVTDADLETIWTDAVYDGTRKAVV